MPTPIEFPEQTVIIAKDQPQYIPLPAYQYERDRTGTVVFCWQLSEEELAELIRNNGVLYHTVQTFNRPLQPTMLDVVKPNMPPHAPKGPPHG